MMKTILVVDDELSVLEAFNVVLKDRYEVITSEGGKEALEIAVKSHPDLIILDIVMPEMDGMEMLRKLKGVNCSSTVVVVTSARTIKMAVEAMKAGAYGYVTKPLDVEEIGLVVERALQSRGTKPSLNFQAQVSSQKTLPLQKAVDNFEKKLIQDALTKNNGVQTKAAKSLKISRRILKYKMDKLGIESLNGKQKEGDRK
jgi:DNA-binding NtrC family response regulator